LFLALLELPIGFYIFLRIVVTVGAGLIVYKEYDSGLNFWVLTFSLIAIVFNPLYQIYLHDQVAWIPIDVISGIMFFIKGFLYSK